MKFSENSGRNDLKRGEAAECNTGPATRVPDSGTLASSPREGGQTIVTPLEGVLAAKLEKRKHPVEETTLQDTIFMSVKSLLKIVKCSIRDISLDPSVPGGRL